MPHVLSNQTNVASTSGLLSSNTDAMVTSFHQTLNFITKYLKISCLDKVYQQVNGGIHEDVHAKQLLESHGQHNPKGIIVTSRIQVHEQRVQFLFENTHAMTRVVGVGLDYAQIYWTQNNEILVEAIEENEWGQLWQEAFTIGSSFHEPILMYMPSDVNDVESLSGQTIEEICWDDVFGTISSCGEVFLLELVTTFFMTRKVIDDYEIPMTIQDSSSTRPNAINNIGWESKFDCDSIKNFTIGDTQHPNNLLGLLWNIFSSGGTHVGGVLDCIVGNEDDGQGALSQNGGIDGGGDNNTHGDGGANASGGWIDICDNYFQGGGMVVNVGSDNNTHQGGGRVNATTRGVDVGGDNVTHDGGVNGGGDNNAEGDEKVDVGGDNDAQGDGKVDVGGDNVTQGGRVNGGGDNDAQGGGKVHASGNNNAPGNGSANGGGGVGSGSGEMRLEGVGDLVENHHDEYQGALSQNDKGANVGGDNNAQGSGDSCGGVGGGSNDDDNNAKDSEGGGGDNNAHGNDNNGDGVGGRNDNDGNEQGDDDGGDNNERSGGDGDKDGHPTKKAQNAIVKVQPGSKGYWYNRKKKIRIDDPKDLKDVCITPYLSFEFLIDAHGLKTMKTTISVLFDMKGAMPNENETKRFGWFQRQLKVSLECSEDGAAKLRGDGVLEQEDESQKRIWMENTQSNSGHTQYGMNGSVRGGLPMIQGELGGLLSRSLGTSSSMRQHTIEIPNKQISGGFVPIRMTSGGNKPCLSYKFNYMKYPKDINEVDSEAKRELYITTGLCSSLSPKVVGTWDELDDDKLSYLYTFEAQRIVCELKKTNTMFGIIKSKSIRREVEQKYKVGIHVNHKMTHICKFKPRKAFKEDEKDTIGELLEVGRIESPPRQPLLTPLPPSSVSHHSFS